MKKVVIAIDSSKRVFPPGKEGRARAGGGYSFRIPEV